MNEMTNETVTNIDTNRIGGVCPHCGYCPHCGRPRQYQPYYPYYSPWLSPWGGTYTIECTTPTITASNTCQCST